MSKIEKKKIKTGQFIIIQYNIQNDFFLLAIVVFNWLHMNKLIWPRKILNNLTRACHKYFILTVETKRAKTANGCATIEDGMLRR